MKAKTKTKTRKLPTPPNQAGGGHKPAQQVVVTHHHQLPQDPTLALIERAARDPDVDVSKMRELLQMKKDHEADLRAQRAEEARMAYQRDMIEAQAAMDPIARTADNKQTTSKYAKLEHISKVIKPVYSEKGFALTFTSPKPLENGTMLIGVWVLHREGHKEYHELPGQIETAGFKGNANMTGLQGLGKLISYLRRYLTCMVFDVILYNEDTDGQADPGEKQQAKQDPFTEGNAVAGGQDWDAIGVQIGGKLSALKYNAGEDAGSKAVQAANYLKAVISKRNHKKSRIELINENLPLVRALIKEKRQDVVDELHALADKGAA